jgi:hypothetical protein
MKFFSLLVLTAALSQSVLAADCVITINRTPCAGSEAEALKPYDGKNPTTEKIKKATTAVECTAAGEKASVIVRAGVVTKKVVKISFDGKEIGEKTGEKACK